MKKIIFTSLCITTLITSAVFALPSGLVKTQLDKWQYQEFKDTGLKIDLPIQPASIDGAYFIEELATPKSISGIGCKLIRIKLHPVYPKGLTDEPFYLININIGRLDEQNYKKFKSGNHHINGFDQFREKTDEFYNSLKSFRLEVPGFQDREKDIIQIFRKDYRAFNGDYILCGAYIYAGSDKYIPPKDADTKAVERILKSIKITQ